MAASDAVPRLKNLLPDKAGGLIADDAPHIGVLALQGAFVEHAHALGRLGARCTEVRQASDLRPELDGLIIPGGESTTMAIVARTLDLVEPLRAFVASGRPVFGTCAGLIFLSEEVTGQKQGGQSVIGGLNVLVHRNFFGRQIDSAERPVRLASGVSLQRAGHGADGATTCPKSANSDGTYTHVFIRAPAVLRANEGVSVLATLEADEREAALLKEHQVGCKEQTTGLCPEGAPSSSHGAQIIVAVQQGPLLATAFHPELTDDLTWHAHFLDMVRDAAAADGDGGMRAVKRTRSGKAKK